MLAYVKPRLSDSKNLEIFICGLGLFGKSSERKFAWKLLIAIQYALIVFGDILLIISEVITRTQLVELAQVLSQALTVHLTTVKYFILIKFEYRYEEICFKFKRIQKKYTSETDFQMKLMEVSQFSRKICLTYSFCVALTTIGYYLLGIGVGLYTTYVLHEPEWLLPLKLHKKLISSNIFYYCIQYYQHIQTCFVVSSAAVVVESLLIEYQIKLCALLKILNEKFCALLCDDGRRTMDQARFHEIVHFHNDIIDVCKTLSTLYSPIIFSQFIVSGIALCFLGFVLLLGVTNLIETFTLYAFAVAVLSQPLIYAYASERIVDESMAISTTIYGSHWYEKVASDQKLIKFCLMRSQMPLMLKSPFYSVNLMTFGAIVKATFSYITLLRTIMAE